MPGKQTYFTFNVKSDIYLAAADLFSFKIYLVAFSGIIFPLLTHLVLSVYSTTTRLYVYKFTGHW